MAVILLFSFYLISNQSFGGKKKRKESSFFARPFGRLINIKLLFLFSAVNLPGLDKRSLPASQAKQTRAVNSPHCEQGQEGCCSRRGTSCKHAGGTKELP